MVDRMSSSAGAQQPDFQLPYTNYGYGGQNGRVNFNSQSGSGGSIIPDSAGFKYQTHAEDNFAGDMLRGNWDHTPLSDSFFTSKNVSILQSEIRKGVYRTSGPKQYTIDDQDVDELKIIMRAMYLQYAKNNTFNIEGQIAELNDFVIKWSIPRIISEIEMHNYNMNDISHLPIPMQQPVSMSAAGTRSLPFKAPL